MGTAGTAVATHDSNTIQSSVNNLLRETLLGDSDPSRGPVDRTGLQGVPAVRRADPRVSNLAPGVMAATRGAAANGSASKLADVAPTASHLNGWGVTAAGLLADRQPALQAASPSALAVPSGTRLPEPAPLGSAALPRAGSAAQPDKGNGEPGAGGGQAGAAPAGTSAEQSIRISGEAEPARASQDASPGAIGQPAAQPTAETGPSLSRGDKAGLSVPALPRIPIVPLPSYGVHGEQPVPLSRPLRLTTACLGAHTTLCETAADQQSFHRAMQRKMQMINKWLQACDFTAPPDPRLEW